MIETTAIPVSSIKRGSRPDGEGSVQVPLEPGVKIVGTFPADSHPANPIPVCSHGNR